MHPALKDLCGLVIMGWEGGVPAAPKRAAMPANLCIQVQMYVLGSDYMDLPACAGI